MPETVSGNLGRWGLSGIEFFAPSLRLTVRILSPCFRTLQLVPLIAFLLFLTWVFCAVLNLLIHPEYWVDILLYPVEAMPTYADYAWSRIKERVSSKLSKMFMLTSTD